MSAARPIVAPTSAGGADPHRWPALAVVGAAFFMTVMDTSIVNVALPSIQTALHVSRASLQWVLTAYVITFGGFLLLGGRAADLLGRRRVFVGGVALFTVCSLVCGLAGSAALLIAARAAQGLGAAIVSPAALSIVMTAFAEGPARNRALGIWGALGGSGAAVGVVAGGVLTQYVGWAWIFFVNVPIGVLVCALTWPLVRESRLDGDKRQVDLAGAVSVTAGLAVLVYAIATAPDAGWATARTIGLLAASAALLMVFVIIETRAAAPLVPFRIFRVGTVAGANIVGFLLGAVLFSSFFLLTLYVQQVLHYSALLTGVTFLAATGTTVLVSGLAQGLTTRLGPRPVMALGALLWAAAMVYLTRIPVQGSFVSTLLPGYLLIGFGLPLALVPVSIAALAGVEGREAGLAAGLITTAQQVGGAIGIALASTIAASHAATLLRQGRPVAEALTSGYALGFWAIAAVAGTAVLASLALIRPHEASPPPAVPAASPAGERPERMMNRSNEYTQMERETCTRCALSSHTLTTSRSRPAARWRAMPTRASR